MAPVFNGEVAGFSMNGGAGVVEEQVEPPVFVDDVGDDPLGVFVKGDIQVAENRLTAGLVDSRGHRFGAFLVDVHADHRGAQAAKFLAQGAAKPRGAAGDDGDLVVKVVHGLPYDTNLVRMEKIRGIFLFFFKTISVAL